MFLILKKKKNFITVVIVCIIYCFIRKCHFITSFGNRDSLIVGKSARLVIERRRVRLPAGAAAEFFKIQSQLCVLTLIPCPFYPRVTAVARKRPDHSAKSADVRLHLNRHTPLIQRSRSGLTMPLCRHSVGTYQETSSHATRQGTLSHSRLSALSHGGLILA